MIPLRRVECRACGHTMSRNAFGQRAHKRVCPGIPDTVHTGNLDALAFVKDSRARGVFRPQTHKYATREQLQALRADADGSNLPGTAVVLARLAVLLK